MGNNWELNNRAGMYTNSYTYDPSFAGRDGELQPMFPDYKPPPKRQAFLVDRLLDSNARGYGFSRHMRGGTESNCAYHHELGVSSMFPGRWMSTPTSSPYFKASSVSAVGRDGHDTSNPGTHNLFLDQLDRSLKR